VVVVNFPPRHGRETPKNVVKNTEEEIDFGVSVDVFVFNFSTRSACKTFLCGDWGGGIVAQRPWWIGGSEAKKGPGSDSPFRYFFNGVFELPPLTEKKRDSKKWRKKRFWSFCRFFCI
jgi:hypothetical protein